MSDWPSARPRRSSAFFSSDVSSAAEEVAYKLGDDYGLTDDRGRDPQRMAGQMTAEGETWVWADGTIYDPAIPGYRQATPDELRRNVPDPCPMGCGRTTEDPYGGPCGACWDATP